jgi:2-polyprenyl-6-methoxyphenol hydroxylase-like FAD-dependent oxidoreductase
MRIAIIGAGLAGLALAQKMRHEGADVVVFERDAGPDARRQGFRITVDEHGFGALRTCLTEELHQEVLASAGPPGGYFRITDERLRDAVVVTFDPETAVGRQVDRRTLRSVLLTGLDPVVRWGTPAASLVAAGDRVVVNGETFDFVAIADGIGSRLRKLVLPEAEPVDLGLGGIYGRTPLTDPTLIPPHLESSGILALLPRPELAFFVTAMRFPDDRPDYLMWSVIPSPELAASLARATPAELVHQALSGVSNPVMRRIVAGTEPGQVLFSRFAAGRLSGPQLIPNAAVLGDAIHPMPPLGAHGGNTALRDAGTLAKHLLSATPSTAATRYRAEMTAYAKTAIRGAERQTRLVRTAPATWLMRRALPLVRRQTPVTKAGVA